MSSIPSDLSSLCISYEIGLAVHTAGDFSHSAGFRAGPNSAWNQTKQGLILEVEDGIPSSISGPFGQWSILPVGGDYSPVKPTIDFFGDRIELEPLDQNHLPSSYTFSGQLYAVKRWDDRKITPIEYKDRQDYIPAEIAHSIWNEHFHPFHTDLSLKGDGSNFSSLKWPADIS